MMQSFGQNVMLDPLLAKVVWEPVLPPIAIVAIGVVLTLMTIYSYTKAASRIALPKRLFLGLLRLAAILGICLLLLQPMEEQSIAQTHPSRVALVGLDLSQSMGERDGNDQATRLDAARQLISESGLLSPDDATDPSLGEVRFSGFDKTSTSIPSRQLPIMRPNGETTHIHESLSGMLESVNDKENCVGLFLFSDGHDFELTPPARTAQIARSRNTPIYPIAIGEQQDIPDVSTYISSFQPYTYVGQRTQIQAAVRLSGTGTQELRVNLFREGEFVREKKIHAESGYEVPVSFEVAEDDPGQYEYEIQVRAILDERELANNKTATFLNVTDAKMPILLIEGKPHWDTTFLRRTLNRNARAELCSVTKAGDRILIAGNSPVDAVPETAEQFANFPLVILGQDVGLVLSEEACANLAEAVEMSGATLVFSRGPAGNQELDALAPAPWTDNVAGPVRVVPGRGSSQIVPLEILESAPGGSEALPELPWANVTEAPLTLAAVEALAEDGDDGDSSPAFVHRRHGEGQVLAVAVGGSWRWSLNSQAESTNNVYDRFWNQLLMNLLARSGSSNSNQPRLTVSSANIEAGEKMSFSLHVPTENEADVPPSPVLQLTSADGSINEPIALTRPTPDGAWIGTYVTTEPGRYRGEIAFNKSKLTTRFAVYQTQRETTEVTPDLPYLRRLAQASGGRVLDASDLKKTIAELARAAVAESEAPPIIKRTTLWDTAFHFYSLFAILGIEWFLRRRWGLA